MTSEKFEIDLGLTPTEKLKEKKERLEQHILNLIEIFIAETGLELEVLDFEMIRHMHMNKTDFYKITGIKTKFKIGEE